MSYERLDARLDGPVATIALHRPDKGNALDMPMWHELRSAMGWLDETPEARVGGRLERPARERSASVEHLVARRGHGGRPRRRNGDPHPFDELRRGALGPAHADPDDVLAGRDG
mgnify:CR=1 FL=1